MFCNGTALISCTGSKQAMAYLTYKGQQVSMPKDGLQDDCGKRTGKWQHAQVREGTLSLIEAYCKPHTVGGTNRPQKPFPEEIHVIWGHFTDEIKMLRCHHEAGNLKYN